MGSELMFKNEFEGQVAVIAGGSRGLGKEVGYQFAAGGAKVYIADIREDVAKETAREFSDMGLKAEAAYLDVVDEDCVKDLFKRVATDNGRFDIKINAAGIIGTETLLEATLADARKVIEVDLLGVSNTTTNALKEMIALGKPGKICNFTSIAGNSLARGVGFPHYGVAKCGAAYFTRAAAYIGAPHNINVNCIAPGFIRTPMWEKILDYMVDDPRHGSHKDRDVQFEDVIKATIPLARGAQTEADIAYSCLFLCSRFADQITGVELTVDGGSILVPGATK